LSRAQARAAAYGPFGCDTRYPNTHEYWYSCYLGPFGKIQRVSHTYRFAIKIYRHMENQSRTQIGGPQIIRTGMRIGIFAQINVRGLKRRCLTSG